MSDSNSDDADTDLEPPENDVRTLTLEVPLDDLHDDIVEDLQMNGVTVNRSVVARLQPQIESTLYELRQAQRRQQQ